MTFTYDIGLIALCDYITERTNQIPDIREVAMMDQAYLSDLMRFDQVKAYLKTQRKRKHA